MDVSISARHVTITPRLEEVIHDKIGGLDRFLQGLDHAEVHFDEARNPRITQKESCEVVVEGHGHHLRCKVHAPDPFSAVDAATLKLERQIRKLRTRLQRRHHGEGQTLRDLAFDTGAPIEPSTMSEADHGDVEADEQVLPRIVKTKRFYLAPMSAEDAVLKMDLLGHGFFFFINAETSRSAVVYRRDDGDVGLIDEAG